MPIFAIDPGPGAVTVHDLPAAATPAFHALGVVVDVVLAMAALVVAEDAPCASGAHTTHLRWRRGLLGSGARCARRMRHLAEVRRGCVGRAPVQNEVGSSWQATCVHVCVAAYACVRACVRACVQVPVLGVCACFTRLCTCCPLLCLRAGACAWIAVGEWTRNGMQGCARTHTAARNHV